MDNSTKLLIKHEGLRLKPYKDSVGKLTIGVGRNLDDVGISEEEALFLLYNDMGTAYREATSNFNWFSSLDEVRQDVIVNMIFNLGISRFKGFKKMIHFMDWRLYIKAAEEMLDSKWATQVGPRAIELAKMMKYGKYVGSDL